MEQLYEWKAHELEAWMASWDRHKVINGQINLYPFFSKETSLSLKRR